MKIHIGWVISIVCFCMAVYLDIGRDVHSPALFFLLGAFCIQGVWSAVDGVTTSQHRLMK